MIRGAMSSVYIHPAALVEEGAELGADVYVGPFCTVGRHVRLGDRTRLVSHVVVEGHTEIGADNIFYSFGVVGLPPQDLGYKGEPTKLTIGNRNIFREACSLHRGTAKDRGLTSIGDDNYIMGYCHVAHDCDLKHHIIMANQTALAGHVVIEEYANIGGQSAIVQHVRIGAYSFLGAGTVLRRDLPPYMCAKEFSQVSGPNLVGLKRQGLKEDEVRVACELYKILYLQNLTTEKALGEIQERFPTQPVATRFVNFMRSSKIGIQR